MKDSAPKGGGYVTVYATYEHFAALHNNGSLFTWPEIQGGVTGPQTIPGGFQQGQIFSNSNKFAALTEDGSIVSWGEDVGGAFNQPTEAGYITIHATEYSFAAMKIDGSITSWGDPSRGGEGAPTDFDTKAIYSNRAGFAAISNEGFITVWPEDSYYPWGTDSGYISITPSQFGFAALHSDGHISAWGSGSDDAPELTERGFVAIYATANAFAAVKEDGSIHAWGPDDAGKFAPTDNGYIAIHSTSGAFAAWKDDGTITMWGARDGDCLADAWTSGSRAWVMAGPSFDGTGATSCTRTNYANNFVSTFAAQFTKEEMDLYAQTAVDTAVAATAIKLEESQSKVAQEADKSLSLAGSLATCNAELETRRLVRLAEAAENLAKFNEEEQEEQPSEGTRKDEENSMTAADELKVLTDAYAKCTTAESMATEDGSPTTLPPTSDSNEDAVTQSATKGGDMCYTLCQTTAETTNSVMPGAGDAALASCNAACDLASSDGTQGLNIPLECQATCQTSAEDANSLMPGAGDQMLDACLMMCNRRRTRKDECAHLKAQLDAALGADMVDPTSTSCVATFSFLFAFGLCCTATMI
jgi:hypothetical protein